MLMTTSAVEVGPRGMDARKRNAWVELVPPSPEPPPPLKNVAGVQHHGGEILAAEQSCLDRESWRRRCFEKLLLSRASSLEPRPPFLCSSCFVRDPWPLKGGARGEGLEMLFQETATRLHLQQREVSPIAFLLGLHRR